MALRSLYLRGLPGFERKPLEYDNFSPGLNIITGPNGSGKTSTCRGIKRLLWPDQFPPLDYPELCGVWEIEGSRLEISLRGERYQWTIDGQRIEPWDLPPPYLADCFFITVDDIFQEQSQGDDELVATVRREFAGGFDLAKLKALPEINRSPKSGEKLKAKLEEAGRLVQDLRAAQGAIVRREAELAGYEHRLLEAVRAAGRREQLRLARELQQHRMEVRGLEERLAGFPACTGSLRGDEGDVLRRIQSERKKLNERILDLSHRIQGLKEQIDSAKLTDRLTGETLSEVEITTQQEILQQLRYSEVELQRITENISRVEGESAPLIQRLTEDGLSPEASPFSAAQLSELERGYERLDMLKQQERALRSERSLLTGERDADASQYTAEQLRAASSLFSRWLAYANSELPATFKRTRLLTWMLCAAIMLLSIFVAWTYHPLLLLLLLLPLAVLVNLPRSEPSTEILRGIERELARYGVPLPKAWEEPEVSKAAADVERWLRDAATRETNARRAAELDAKAELLAQEIQAAERGFKAFLESAGLAGDMANLPLPAMLRSVVEVRARATELAGLRATRGAIINARQGLLQKLNTVFLAFGLAEAEGSADAAALLCELHEKCALVRSAAVELRGMEATYRELSEQRSRLNDDERSLFSHAGLTPDQEGALNEGIAALKEYQRATEALQAVRFGIADKTSKLDDEGRRLQELSLEQLALIEAEVEHLAATQGDLGKTIGGIKSEVDRLREDNRLELALADLELQREQLTEVRERSLLSEAAQFLIDDVSREYAVENQPAVFTNADRLFRLFTRGRYALRMPEADGGHFRAEDVRSGQRLELSQLSRGARMQLLLAVRVSFAEQRETRLPLPLVLDEVPSNSDPERFRAILEAMLKLAQEGRQLFYLSCRPSDGEAWTQLAASLGIKAVGRFELEQSRLTDSGDAPLLLRGPLVPEIEAPGTRALAEYASALGVPQLNVADGVQNTHLAHLVDSSDLLYRLLSAGIATYGQLRSLVEVGDTSVFVSKEQLRRIDIAAEIITIVSESWRVGRGMTLTPSVLADAAAKSKLTEAIIQVAEECGWEAKPFVDAIDPDKGRGVKNLRRDLFEKIKDTLAERQYYDERELLSKDASRAQVLYRLRDNIEVGHITTSEVSNLFEHVWNALPTEAAKSAH